MKKIIKYLVGAAAVLYGFFASMLLFGVNGMAYIDPSVMTYVIQVAAGVVIAIGAVIGIYFRKAKKKMEDKLGTEDNKERESDEIIVKSEKE